MRAGTERHRRIKKAFLPSLCLRRWLRRIRGLAYAGLTGTLLLMASNLFAANYVVDSTADTSVAGTLRYALEQANQDGTSVDTITFDASLANFSIDLDSMLPIINKSTGSLTITGLGADQLTINGDNNSRIFFVESGSVVIEDLTLTGGSATGGTGGGSERGGGGGGGLGAGGAVFVNQDAQVTLRNASLTLNQATGGQGGGYGGIFGEAGGGGGGLSGNGGSADFYGAGGGGGLLGNAGSGDFEAGGGGGGKTLDGGDATGLSGGTGGGSEGGTGGNFLQDGQDALAVGGGGGGGGEDSTGGDGHDFGGGGGNGFPDFTSFTAGTGGFGGGGGGAGHFGFEGGAAGFGGGNGGAEFTGGDGGDGLGGALFVREGGQLILENVAIESNQANLGQAGSGIFDQGTNGTAAADGLYVMQNVDAMINVTDGTTVSIEDSIYGAGSVTKGGAGTLNLNTAAYRLDAGITVHEGRLNVNSTVENDIDVDADGQLGGSGDITGNVVNQGLLAPGNSIGTLDITGDYTHGAGAELEVEIDDGGHTDKLNVSGTATLQGGTVNVVSAAGSYTAGMQYTFLEAGSISGTFDAIIDDLAFLDAELGYTSTTAFFTLMSNGSDYADVARGFNQHRVATYLDQHSTGASGLFEQLLDNLDLMNNAQARSTFQELSGEIYGTLAQLNVQNTTQMYRLLSQQATGVGGTASRGDGGTAAGNSDDVQYAYGAPAPKQTGDIVLATYSEETEQLVLVRYDENSLAAWRAWVVGYGLGGNVQSDGNAAGAIYGIGGTTFGIEKWADCTHAIGFWGGYANLNLSTADGLNQSADANNVQLGGYIRYEDDRHYYLLAGAGGLDDYNSRRFIDGGGLNLVAEGETTGYQASAWLERGMIFRDANREAKLFGALNYVYVTQDGFTETGAGALNLNVSDVSTNALRGLLGGRAAWHMQTAHGVYYRPEIHAAWMHEFLETETSLISNLSGPAGPGFTTRGVDYGRDWALFGGGVSLQLTDSLSLDAMYDAQVNDRQVLHLGSGSLTFEW